jgi:hypothetical protein
VNRQNLFYKEKKERQKETKREGRRKKKKESPENLESRTGRERILIAELTEVQMQR